MEEQALGQMNDEGVLAEAIDCVMKGHPTEVARYMAGEEQLMKFLIGQVMKETRGTADAALVRNMLLVKLTS